MSLHGRVEAQMKTIEGLREENVTLRCETSKQEEELRSSAIAGAELEATNASLQRQLSKTHEERQDLRAQITVLESQLRSARSGEASLTAQVADATLRIAGLERELATSQKETMSAVEARVQATKHHHEEIRIITEEYSRRVAEEHERARTLEESSRRQADRLSEVEGDLEDLRQAEQRLRSAERQMGDKQLETLQLVRDALESKLQKEIDQRESAIAELRQVLEQTRRESFQHLACAIKLSLCMSGHACNLDIQSLWDTMTKQGVPSAEWNAWISAEFARNAQEAADRERAAR